MTDSTDAADAADAKDNHEDLPPKPQPPLPDECCGGGCVPCIYDYYYQALAEWEQQVAAMSVKKGANPSSE